MARDGKRRCETSVIAGFLLVQRGRDEESWPANVGINSHRAINLDGFAVLPFPQRVNRFSRGAVRGCSATLPLAGSLNLSTESI